MFHPLKNGMKKASTTVVDAPSFLHFSSKNPEI